MPHNQAPKRLRVLHLEDSEVDHELACAHLRRSGQPLQVKRVDTETDFRGQLAGGGWDAVLADFNVPGFDGLKALEVVKQVDPTLPFVLLSGEIGEDLAVAAMRSGATDYLLKDNMARLAPALENAIEASLQRRARQQSEQALAQSRQRLSELAQHLQTRIEAERAAIAREIHDEVGGALTALKFDLAWLQRHAEKPDVHARLQSSLETLDHAIEASKRIMHNLRPAILEQGLVAALQWMAARFERRTDIACQFRTSHESMQLPTGVPLVAYRFAQEALTNVSKHAQATRVSVDLSLARGVLSLEVADNGRGLGAEDLAKARSFGIRGLHERAGTLGGWVEISSSTRGTVLLLSIPIRAALDSAVMDGPEEHERDHDPSVWGGHE